MFFPQFYTLSNISYLITSKYRIGDWSISLTLVHCQQRYRKSLGRCIKKHEHSILNVEEWPSLGIFSCNIMREARESKMELPGTRVLLPVDLLMWTEHSTEHAKDEIPCSLSLPREAWTFLWISCHCNMVIICASAWKFQALRRARHLQIPTVTNSKYSALLAWTTNYTKLRMFRHIGLD